MSETTENPVTDTHVLSRMFKHNDTVLPDPNPDFTLEEVKEYYMDTIPELLNTQVQYSEEKDGYRLYEFKQKGSSFG